MGTTFKLVDSILPPSQKMVTIGEGPPFPPLASLPYYCSSFNVVPCTPPSGRLLLRGP